MVMEGYLTWGGECTVQYTDDVLQDCTPETYVLLLTSVITTKFNKKQKQSLTKIMKENANLINLRHKSLVESGMLYLYGLIKSLLGRL